MKPQKQLKKSELRTDTTYLLCPDDSCKKFFDSSNKFFCEYECPNENKLVKIIVCRVCRDMIELPGKHTPFYRVDSKNHRCKDERTPSVIRQYKKYEIIYQIPG
ncbi:MAG: hypothetical protein AABW81_03825 [Nanoarchaeota archaeon]